MEKIIKFKDYYGTEREAKLIEAKCFEKVLIPLPINSIGLSKTPIYPEFNSFMSFEKVNTKKIINIDSFSIHADDLDLVRYGEDYHLLLTLIAGCMMIDIEHSQSTVFSMCLTNRIGPFDDYINTFITGENSFITNGFMVSKLSDFIKENYLND